MKLIVGLGNPGNEYKNTRHNIGFMVLDKIANELNESFNKENFSGKYFMTNINGEKTIFLKPQKYMNLSGEVVRDYVPYYKIDLSDIIIIVDDLDLPTGKIRLRTHGSSGGHNGLKNIFSNLGTENIKRIKIGISNNKDIDTKDYVLGNIKNEEKELIDDTVLKVSNISLEAITSDFNTLMSKYN